MGVSTWNWHSNPTLPVLSADWLPYLDFSFGPAQWFAAVPSLTRLPPRSA